MVCQSCLQSKANIDEVDMYPKFNGHEGCYLKNMVITEIQELTENYETDLNDLRGQIDTLEEKLLEYTQAELEQETVHYY